MPTFQISDTKLTFTVSRYGPKSFWADVTLGIENRNIKYHDYGEILAKDEVDELIQTLNDLLNDKIKEKELLLFLEPDIRIVCYPAQVVTSDCYIELTINFSRTGHGEFKGKNYTITLKRRDIIALLEGLKKEIGKK